MDKIWLLLIIFILIIFVVAIYYLTYRSLFFPTKDIVWHPSIPYDNLYLTHNQEIFLKKPLSSTFPYINLWSFDIYSNRPYVLFCHGNAGNISHREYVWKLCQELKINLLLLDYRGYGESSGDASPDNIYQDGLLAYDYLLKKVDDPKKIIIWGESLGGAVATYIAAHREANCLILIATFASLEDVIFRHPTIPWYIRTIGIFIKHFIHNLPSKEYINKVNSPVLILHSKEDELINYENAQILFDNVPHKMKDFITIRGGHSTPEFDGRDMIMIEQYINNSENIVKNYNLTPIMKLIKQTSKDFHNRYDF